MNRQNASRFRVLLLQNTRAIYLTNRIVRVTLPAIATQHILDFALKYAEGSL